MNATAHEIIAQIFRATDRTDVDYRSLRDEGSDATEFRTAAERFVIGDEYEDGVHVGYTWSTYQWDADLGARGEWDFITTDGTNDEVAARRAVTEWLAQAE